MVSMSGSIIETFDDLLLADFYEQHWLELLGRDGDRPIPGWRDRFLDFTRRARTERAMRAYIATVDGIACGSASCHLVDGTFPAFRHADIGAWGYVWGVYVLPERRGQRIGASETGSIHLRWQSPPRRLRRRESRAQPASRPHRKRSAEVTGQGMLNTERARPRSATTSTPSSRPRSSAPRDL